MPRSLLPALAPCLAAAVSAGAIAAPPVPFETNAWGADTGFYLADGNAWWPEAMVTGDFDGNGRLDVAVTNWGNFLPIAPRVSILLAGDDGRWGAATHLVTPAQSSAIATADLDGDGHLDLVVTDGGTWWTETTITVLRGAGDGTFATGGTYDVGAAGPTDVALADLDGDGILDAVTANHGTGADSISVLPGDGDGGFGSASVFPAVDGARTLDVGDADGDGDIDVAVARMDFLIQSTHIALLRNDGAGVFGAPEPLDTLASSAAYRPALRFADMDADGDLDLVYSDSGVHLASLGSAYIVAVFPNDGTGTFAAPDRHVVGAYTGGFTSLAIADFDGDGRLDVAGTHDANESWSILYGLPGGGLGDHVFLSAGEYPTDVAVADVDDDGAPEILVLAHFSQTVMVHDPAGTRLAAAPNVSLVFGGHYHFDVADIDADGDLDVAASSGYAVSGSISILRQSAAGDFGPFPITYTAPTYASSVKLRDLDGDGFPDLLWADKNAPYSFRWRLNDGTGTFLTTQSSPDVFTCGVTLDDAVGAWDFDADGDLDVVLMENLGCGGGAGNKRLFVTENDGSASFTLHTIIETYLAPSEMMAGDVNGDGNLDIVVAAHAIEVFLGQGDLTFSSGTVYGGIAATNGTLADVNADGHLDVLLTIPAQNQPRESFAVMRGAGDGSFAAPTLYPATRSPNLGVQTSIATSDVDGDGDLDVLLGNYASNSMSLFTNRGDGTFDPQVHVAAMDAVRDVAFADLTGDGVPDALGMARFSTAGELGRDGIAILAGTAPAGVPGDVDGDGSVGLSDLLTVLSTWGACTGCPADLDGDGTVGFADLLLVLAAWT